MFLYLFVIVISVQSADSQEITIGTLYSDEDAYDGLTLFAPFNNFGTYLVDNCGELYNSWESESRLSSSVYLKDNGNLLRTARVGGSFAGGGLGGKIEEFSWDGDLIWEFTYADDDNHLHHDIEILPNGNILAIAWERKTAAEAALKGKIGNVSSSGLWPDQIIEIQRGGPQDGEIVWSWHVWDHLVQDTDPELDDYGIPEDHPERININFQSQQSDWIHLNGIDYNPILDQIIISSRHLSEIWIIDHSTTTDEAAGSTGGNSGKGGDLLYRWGNPQAYNRGSNLDQILFGPHDIRWIEPGLPNEGQLTVFNNGTERSSVSIINADVNPDGSYNLSFDQAYLPEAPEWTFDGGDEYFFFSSSISGTQLLQNGNMLITDGEAGNLLEIDREGNPHWIYEIPVNNTIMSQGDFPTQNQLFKAQKYDRLFSGFEGKDLISQGPLELNPVDNGCMIISSSTQSDFTTNNIRIKQNPVEGIYEFTSDTKIGQILILNQMGQIVYQSQKDQSRFELLLDQLSSGIYYAKIETSNASETIALVKF